MPAWFLLRDREGVDLDSRGDGEELRGGGGNCNQDIVCEGTIYFLRHIRPSASTSQRRNWTQAVWPNFILTVSWSQSTPRACIVPIAQCISATSSQNSCNCPLPTSKRISTHKMKGEQEDESSPSHTHSCLPWQGNLHHFTWVLWRSLRRFLHTGYGGSFPFSFI